METRRVAIVGKAEPCERQCPVTSIEKHNPVEQSEQEIYDNNSRFIGEYEIVGHGEVTEEQRALFERAINPQKDVMTNKDDYYGLSKINRIHHKHDQDP